MPKLIDYPRTSYAGAWELSEIVDDTGGKCAIETAARKLNRKVSGSFKAIIGSAVKFGLLTSKRDLLSTTTLFKRIKHAYDKSEELVFHREAFLTPPLFTQLCRKFRSRELPVQMLDVMLIREFGVEEINAQGVAKAFVDGARMVGLLDERNIIADIDALSTSHTPRRELASPPPSPNAFRTNNSHVETDSIVQTGETADAESTSPFLPDESEIPNRQFAENRAINVPKRAPNGPDVIANLFGFITEPATQRETSNAAQHETTATEQSPVLTQTSSQNFAAQPQAPAPALPQLAPAFSHDPQAYLLQVSGPGVNSTLDILEEEDIAIAIALLEKIRRQLKAVANS